MPGYYLVELLIHYRYWDKKNVNPAVASLLLSLESCFSVLAGWIVLGERLSIREMSGCILMFAAIILAQVPEKKKR